MSIASVSRSVVHNGPTGSHPTTRASNPRRNMSSSGEATKAENASPSGQGVVPTPAGVVAYGSAAQVSNSAAAQIVDVKTPGKPAFSLPTGETFPIRSAAAKGPRSTAGPTDTNLRLGTPGKPAFSLPTGETFPIRSAAQQPGSVLDVRA